MGKRGIAPKPTSLRILHGDRKDRINVNEPLPANREIAPPFGMTHDAQDVWHRLAPDLIAKKVLTAWDVDAFASFCNAVVINREAWGSVHEHGMQVVVPVRVLSDGTTIYDLRRNPAWQVARESSAMIVTLGGRFGLTPSDRAQLSLTPEEDDGQGVDRLFG